MNNTIYYDSPVSDEQRRQLLFDGQLLVYAPRPSTLALIRFARRLINNNTSGTSFIIYDNSAASGTIIGTVTTATAALGSWHYGLPFYNGLTIVTSGNSLDMTVVYE